MARKPAPWLPRATRWVGRRALKAAWAWLCANWVH